MLSGKKRLRTTEDKKNVKFELVTYQLIGFVVSIIVPVSILLAFKLKQRFQKGSKSRTTPPKENIDLIERLFTMFCVT